MSALRPHLDDVLRRRFGVTDPVVLRLLARAVVAAADGHAALDLAAATAATPARPTGPTGPPRTGRPCRTSRPRGGCSRRVPRSASSTRSPGPTPS